MTVWDYDRFKANDFLGEVVIDLSGTSKIEKYLKMFELQSPENYNMYWSQQVEHIQVQNGRN